MIFVAPPVFFVAAHFADLDFLYFLYFFFYRTGGFDFYSTWPTRGEWTNKEAEKTGENG